ncbi:glucose dehydrogenase [FAD, quinone]-like [Toxorhynchites rutilus septentrionalis]|uniref:glucose dehydrogenase [FAD, quinone]-like n=1 Tax=Toxorhynchites rutilus septentrionalis TaxID=329112 RepID=UPI00247832DD|nr:glucose dehydrogenase [FAD, quinone]-like [Toxorhynchites rutilus septentrionalis]
MIYELQRTSVDWEYNAKRSRSHSLSSLNGASWPRGLALGGSGTINGMKYMRGNKGDYDRWEQLGNPGWGWDNVLEYFKRSENNQAVRLVQSENGKWHSRGGYLSVDYYDMSDPTNRLLMKAAKQMGFKRLSDSNAAQYVGYGRSQFTIVNATRCSPAKAFLSSIKDRKNLHVIKHAFATSISFAADDKTARGINFILRNQYSMRALASKEVIISAGAVNTPKLLMLSGIGRKHDIVPLRIPLRADLNVGGNLQDHVAVPLFFKFNKSFQRFIHLNLEKVLNLFEFIFKNPNQPLTNHDVSSVIIYMNTLNATSPYPDVQVEHYQFIKGGDSSIVVTEAFGYDQDIVRSIHQAELEANVVMVRINVLNPKSRGRITLRSNDPYADPGIEAGYFSVYDDLRTLVRAVRIEQQMLNTESFRQNEAELHRLSIPACKFIEYDTDEYWECYIRHLSITLYHPAGTAKMGLDDDPTAVVDSRLRVRQVNRLRVIDASIMPYIVSGNLNAPTIMIGEKGSDLVREDHGF